MKGTLFLFFLSARLPFLERESMADGVHGRKRERRGLTCRQRNGGLAVLSLLEAFKVFKVQREKVVGAKHTQHSAQA